MASQPSSLAASAGLSLLSAFAIALLLVTLYILGVVASFAVFCVREFSERAQDRPPLIGTVFRMLKEFDKLFDAHVKYALAHRTSRLVFPGHNEIWTADPAVIEHILKTSFSKYNKGDFNYQIMKDLFGDGIFATDGEKWRHQRKLASHEFSTRVLRDFSSGVFKTNAAKLAEKVSYAAANKISINMQNLRNVNTEELLDEFVLLFSYISQVSLNENKDAIVWKWTGNGEYTAASAYEAQFLGSYAAFNAATIWQAKTEPKCRFFAWLATLGKAPTADNLLKKNWPCNPFCALCYCMPETNKHILTECNFMEAVWDKVAQIFHLHPAIAPFQKGDILGWLSAISRTGSKAQQRRNAGIIFFSWWYVWKERNHRIFEYKESSFLQVVEQIKSAITSFLLVCLAGS